MGLGYPEVVQLDAVAVFAAVEIKPWKWLIKNPEAA